MSITKAVLKSAVDSSSKILLDLSTSIKKVEFPEPIELTVEISKLNDNYISDRLKIIPAGYAKKCKETDFIYVFEIQKSTPTLQKSIFDGLCASRDVQSAKDFEGKKDICRAIHSNSSYMYVGRSQKLRSRLKQHLDGGNEGVFAMHLLRWALGIEATIKVYCYQFDKQENLIVQALEDGLWDRFQPMFGRKGEK